MDYSKEFKETGVVLMKGMIPPTIAQKFSDWLWKLHHEGFTFDDDHQAMKSHSIYGVKIIQAFAEASVKKFSNLLGIELAPTYVYSRIYKPGEELIIHRDRPECEISVTVNLARHGPNWPIYYSNDEDADVKHTGTEILLEPGDALWYHGYEMYHWRYPWDEAKEGDWLTQTFFHYVDANGRFKDRAHDQRNYMEKYFANSSIGVYDSDQVGR